MNRRLYVFMLAAVMAAALGLGGCMAGDGKKEENEKPIRQVEDKKEELL